MSKTRAGTNELINDLDSKGVVAISIDEAANIVTENKDLEKRRYDYITAEFENRGWIWIPADKSAIGSLFIKPDFILSNCE